MGIPLSSVRMMLAMQAVACLVLVYSLTASLLTNARRTDMSKVDTMRPPTDRKSAYSGTQQGGVSWLRAPEDFFLRLQDERQSRCRKLLQMGRTVCRGLPIASKYVCLDPDVTLPLQNCVVYSFGIGTDASFDRQAADYGCTVYMFDPTLPPGSYNQLQNGMTFFPFGLAGSSMTTPFQVESNSSSGGVRNMTLLTYSDVHKLLRYSGPVHYLKIDIEGYEWDSLEFIIDQDLLRGTLQIAVELHLLVSNKRSVQQNVSLLQQRWQVLERLEMKGFKRVWYEPNLVSSVTYQPPGSNVTLQTCGELFLVRRNE